MTGVVHIGKLHCKVLTFHRSVSPHRKPIWLGWDTVYLFRPIRVKTAEPDLYFRLGDATPNGLAMNLPILHDILCISYKDL